MYRESFSRSGLISGSPRLPLVAHGLFLGKDSFSFVNQTLQVFFMHSPYQRTSHNRPLSQELDPCLACTPKKTVSWRDIALDGQPYFQIRRIRDNKFIAIFLTPVKSFQVASRVQLSIQACSTPYETTLGGKLLYVASRAFCTPKRLPSREPPLEGYYTTAVSLRSPLPWRESFWSIGKDLHLNAKRRPSTGVAPGGKAFECYSKIFT